MKVAVLAFGHVHFKAACEAAGVCWQEAAHITHLRAFRPLQPETTRLIVHTTAHDHRQRDLLAEARRLGFL